ncbi:MAG TPA: Cache 3/Cache 2 fusion domain-containing protein [Gemmatimonadaceae bacterium]|jgi:methyl-accepting chemotaxis protein|nr:Cache 3/Cache 2 fusion domain-containing protein [Gemmatimonadaceae bacterium]
MRLHRRVSARVSNGIGFVLALALAGALTAFVDDDGSSRDVAQAKATIEATIFSYDGHDFVRSKTTLVTENGKSAVNTKLEHDTPAYKALMQKRSYTGDATVFGRMYQANYAPLTGDDGQLTGALFVAVAK